MIKIITLLISQPYYPHDNISTNLNSSKIVLIFVYSPIIISDAPRWKLLGLRPQWPTSNAGPTHVTYHPKCTPPPKDTITFDHAGWRHQNNVRYHVYNPRISREANVESRVILARKPQAYRDRRTLMFPTSLNLQDDKKLLEKPPP